MHHDLTLARAEGTSLAGWADDIRVQAAARRAEQEGVGDERARRSLAAGS